MFLDIYAVGVTQEIDVNQLLDIVGEGLDDHLVRVDQFELLDSTLDKVMETICDYGILPAEIPEIPHCKYNHSISL